MGEFRTMTRATRRVAAAIALTVALAAAAAGCRDSDEDPGDPGGPDAVTSATPAEREVVTQVAVGKVAGRLPRAAADRLSDEVGDVVDGWVRAAYLDGTYPRRDFSDSWPGFSAGARRLAHGDRALMSNEDIGARIDGIEPHRIRVRLDVLAVKQRPVGVTAHVAVGFGTTGEVERQVRVTGRLFLTRGDGGWQVFGYDIAKGAV
jgi:hypothetical protein